MEYLLDYSSLRYTCSWTRWRCNSLQYSKHYSALSNLLGYHASGAMQSGSMDHTKTMNMSKLMDNMSVNMKEMSKQMTKGTMNEAQMKKMQERMKDMNKMMESIAGQVVLMFDQEIRIWCIGYIAAGGRGVNCASCDECMHGYTTRGVHQIGGGLRWGDDNVRWSTIEDPCSKLQGIFDPQGTIIILIAR